MVQYVGNIGEKIGVYKNRNLIHYYSYILRENTQTMHALFHSKSNQLNGLPRHDRQYYAHRNKV